jgi:hypothetical protein
LTAQDLSQALIALGKHNTFKELNPRRRVYVEIPRPARVELKWM